MKRTKLYIDTSVLGGIFDIEDQKRVSTAKSFLQVANSEMYESYISLLTLEEITNAPTKIKEGLSSIVLESEFTPLEETEDSLELANIYVNEKVFPPRYRNDARHIAISVYYELDFVVSWNYKHMVNIIVKRLVNSINLKMGYKSIEIISPEEVIEYGNMGL